MKTINSQIQEDQRTSSKSNNEGNLPRHIIIRLLKTANKEKKIIKAARGKICYIQKKDKG